MRDSPNVTLRLLGGLGSSTFAIWLGMIEAGCSDHFIALPRSGNTLIQRTAQIAESTALS
jgi:hypothetical protein